MTSVEHGVLMYAARALEGVLPSNFTGQVTITINWHKGTAAGADIEKKEHAKLNAA